MMPAFRYLGDGEARVVSVPVPEPGPGQVRIKVGGAGLCASDFTVLRGSDAYEVDPPLTLGHETAGWVDALGEGVTGWELGEAVVLACLAGCGRCEACASAAVNYCSTPIVPGITRDGGLAPYMLAEAEQLVRLGDLPVVAAAPLADAAITVHHALDHCAQAVGQRGALLVLGIGGLGGFAVQIAAAQGWDPIIAVDADPRRRDASLGWGAAHFLTPEEASPERIAELAGSTGVKAALDIVGVDQTLATAVESVRVGGRVVQVGTAAGTVPFGRRVVKPGVALVQSRGGTRVDLEAVVALASQGRIGLQVERFALEDTAEAYERLAAGRIRGRAVVTPQV